MDKSSVIEKYISVKIEYLPKKGKNYQNNILPPSGASNFVTVMIM